MQNRAKTGLHKGAAGSYFLLFWRMNNFTKVTARKHTHLERSSAPFTPRAKWPALSAGHSHSLLPLSLAADHRSVTIGLLLRARSPCRRLLDRHQLHFEDQRRVRPDVSRSIRSVGQFGRHKELPLRSEEHT